jgi:hypothetical protein
VATALGVTASVATSALQEFCFEVYQIVKTATTFGLQLRFLVFQKLVPRRLQDVRQMFVSIHPATGHAYAKCATSHRTTAARNPGERESNSGRLVSALNVFASAHV